MKYSSVNGWKIAPLKEVVDIVKEQFNPQDEPEEEYNYLSIGNIQSNTGRLIDFTPTKGSEIKSTKLVFTIHDVLYSRLRPNLNKVHIPKFNGICATDLLPLRPRPLIDRDFLAYYLRTPYVVEYAASRIRGIQLPRLSTNDLLLLPVPVPPMDIQKKIASLLSRVCNRAISTREELSRIPALVRRLRMAILSRAFQGQLTNEWRSANMVQKDLLHILTPDEMLANESDEALLPSTWIEARLGKCVEKITKGESPKWQGFDYVPEGIPFIRSENVLWGYLDLGKAVKIPKAFHQKCKRSQLVPGDVLINIVGASIGRSCVVPSSIKTANINQAVALVRVERDLLLPSYLMYLLISPLVQNTLSKTKVETARANISLTHLKQLVIPIAPISEQFKIVEIIESRFSAIEKLELTTTSCLQNIEYLESSVLNSAFSGCFAPTVEDFDKYEQTSIPDS
ncbi:MAG: restriction endonuclease subunit S [Candidatus Thorarchaeota archaeon]